MREIFRPAASALSVACLALAIFGDLKRRSAGAGQAGAAEAGCAGPGRAARPAGSAPHQADRADRQTVEASLRRRRMSTTRSPTKFLIMRSQIRRSTPSST